MSYEIITRFSINTKKNTFSITAHPNNIVPAYNYSFTNEINENNLKELFENLLFRNYHPTTGMEQLNYAMARAEYETRQKYNFSSDRSLSDFVWKNQIVINGEKIYNPLQDYFFSLFKKYLFEKESPGKFYVTDGRYNYRTSRNEYSYRYTYAGMLDDRFIMSFKRAYTFIFNNSDIKGLRPVLV